MPLLDTLARIGRQTANDGNEVFRSISPIYLENSTLRTGRILLSQSSVEDFCRQTLLVIGPFVNGVLPILQADSRLLCIGIDRNCSARKERSTPIQVPAGAAGGSGL